ncbi:MAG: hypothetical protein JWO56_265 [Acidobacteria bacterium]|nr:hypothetical protein [Acidobacteriota bacterium]
MLVPFFEVDFFDVEAFFDEAFFDEEALRDGTLPPAARASEIPMAMACFRLFTFLPEPPLFNFPSPYSCITFEIFFFDFGPYLLAIPISFTNELHWFVCKGWARGRGGSGSAHLSTYVLRAMTTAFFTVTSTSMVCRPTTFVSGLRTSSS